jgi:hypothetical protein
MVEDEMRFGPTWNGNGYVSVLVVMAGMWSLCSLASWDMVSRLVVKWDSMRLRDSVRSASVEDCVTIRFRFHS